MGFCSRVVVDQDHISKTTKAHHGHFSTFTTDRRQFIQDHSPANEPYHLCHAINDRASDTILGIARWAGKGASYRTIQRFYYIAIPWAQVFWQFLRQHLFRKEEVYILAGDESVVSNAGKKTYRLDRFFSGRRGSKRRSQACPSLSSRWSVSADCIRTRCVRNKRYAQMEGFRFTRLVITTLAYPYRFCHYNSLISSIFSGSL